MPPVTTPLVLFDAIVIVDFLGMGFTAWTSTNVFMTHVIHRPYVLTLLGHLNAVAYLGSQEMVRCVLMSMSVFSNPPVIRMHSATTPRARSGVSVGRGMRAAEKCVWMLMSATYWPSTVHQIRSTVIAMATATIQMDHMPASAWKGTRAMGKLAKVNANFSDGQK